MSLIITSKPFVKAAPRNERAPVINPRLQEALTAVGGIVPASGGPYAGQPVFRLVWGQERSHFCRGKQRLKYLDEDVETIIVQERFFVAPEVFERAAHWQSEREQKRLERFLNCDYTIFTESEPLSGYLKQFESSLDYMQLEDAVGTRHEVSTDVLGVASTVAPKDWIYLPDVKEVIEIGKACWFVEQWIPASWHGGQKEWERLRYTIDAYVPELNAVVPLADDLGEFPEYGFYIPRLQIAEFLKDADGNYSETEFSYTEPTEENCVFPMVEQLYRRTQMTNQDKDRNWRAKQHEEHLFQKRDQLIADKKAETYDLLGLNDEPAMGGRIHVFQS